MIKTVRYLFVVMLLLTAYYYLEQSAVLHNRIIALLVSFMLALLFEKGYHYLNDLPFHWQTDLSPKANGKIRISFAYLLRIMIKDPISDSHKYLLVKSNRIANTYQPPGGVFKMYNADYINEFEGEADNDFHDDMDFRFQLKRKKIPELLKKFDGRMCRETSIEREFYEELIETKILPKELFPWVKSSYLRRRTLFAYSEFFEIDEFKLFEIYDILLTDQQQQHILGLLTQKSQDYVFADAELINKGGYNRGSAKHELKIGPHTKFLIS